MNDIVLYVADPECLDLSMHKMQPFKRVPGDLIDNPYFGLYRALLTPVHHRPSVSVDKERDMGFSNLQTTSRLSSCCCTREVIMGIQNVKKLEISGDEDDYFWESGLVYNLVHLHQLETLSLTGTYILWPRTLPASTPSAKSFPATLKKLNLTSAYLSWSYLDIIAELPNLDVLKLMGFACCG
ncbi:hypothetical protein T459_26670 [Capsicum annuum]|uniref:Uncharacterized protein n=1 Tax=Capsicum annuum TaxID=4072 RepID=A0A2G2YBQ8_CAPAN|nr:hypothetical protein T459_26670 [Capsicum annuum]